MPTIRLETPSDTLDLASVERLGYGVQALSGASGLGLAPVSGQWLEGAGDGAKFRGARRLARDIDMPLLVQGRTNPEFEAYLARLSKVLNDDMTLFWVKDDGSEWYTGVRLAGGGDYVYGQDTVGRTDLRTVVTLRAGDPYFYSSLTEKITVTTDAATGLLTGSLATFTLASSQTMGRVSFVNSGTADAFPVWRIKGPGNNFKAIDNDGNTLWWKGSLAAGKSLTIDVKAGTVIDGDGVNRYDQLADMPRFWTIPAGPSTATVSLLGATPGTSKVTCEWQPRLRLVI